MKLRHLIVFGLLGVLFSAPILFRESTQDSAENPIGNSIDSTGQGTGWWDWMSKENPNNGPASQRSPYLLAGSGSAQSPSSPYPNDPIVVPANGNAGQPIYYAFAHPSEFIRFDISPQWVRSHWPQVSTFPAEDGLDAYRVSVVSGPRPVDIHGSLTYYFGPEQTVQRITFKGWTGDRRHLVSLAEHFGLTPQNSNATALFTKRVWGKLVAAIRLDRAPVAHRDLPNEQLMVLFELTHPRGRLGVSPQTTAILEAMEKGR